MLTTNGNQKIFAFRAPINVTALATRAGVSGHVFLSSDVADFLEPIEHGVWHALYALAQAIPHARGSELVYSFCTFVNKTMSAIQLKATRPTPGAWFVSRCA